MGRIKNLLIEADDLGIPVSGRSLPEIARDIENYHHTEAAIKPFWYLGCLVVFVIFSLVLSS